MKSAPAAARSRARRHADEAREIRAERAKKARVTARARLKRAGGVLKARLRYAARCIPAAALALPLGVLGLLTTPIGRRLGWTWLMHPGRRLFAAMTGKARADLHNDLLAACRDEAEDEDETEISDRVPRDGSRSGEGADVSAYDGEFGFAEAAAEMEEKAQSFDPDGMMQVLAAIDSFPTGLTSIGNIFKLMIERCDEEYPLDPKVGEALSEVFTLLQQAGEAAEEAGKTFREAHEADIERLEDPRVGEEKWNYNGD
ncbi:hypothetical protein E0L36_25210 [Streptomyces sp. AJS327]|uniref:hypothetical protein n=1 Tax=Streptomyces sp. AJS327 TaxID=2545265 RepID=UPI0015DDB9BB|nr:hypothetical protein [Streptomyces sp. AJS327]MBA0054029.1 hypothetical protein [Streptomyces sp. AJS327]